MSVKVMEQRINNIYRREGVRPRTWEKEVDFDIVGISLSASMVEYFVYDQTVDIFEIVCHIVEE